jgi:hypothetical protein
MVNICPQILLPIPMRILYGLYFVSNIQLLLYYYATKSINCNLNCGRFDRNIGTNDQTCISMNMCVICRYQD